MIGMLVTVRMLSRRAASQAMAPGA
jgi:hypothetical protein